MLQALPVLGSVLGFILIQSPSTLQRKAETAAQPREHQESEETPLWWEIKDAKWKETSLVHSTCRDVFESHFVSIRHKIRILLASILFGLWRMGNGEIWLINLFHFCQIALEYADYGFLSNWNAIGWPNTKAILLYIIESSFMIPETH